MNVEDYIELLIEPQYKLDRSDHNLIYSFVRQVSRGLAFTDRQYELAKQKIIDYQDQFIKNGLDPQPDLENVRLPLRKIDRSRWIKIVDYPENIVHQEGSGPYIAVRFTFQKKLISTIEAIKKASGSDGMYDKTNKIHYFYYSEKLLFDIINAVEGKNFELDELSQTIYQKLKTFKQEEHVPGVYNLELKNLHPNGVKEIIKELGDPTPDNLLLYHDRSIKYGLHYVDEISRQDESILAFKVGHRKRQAVAINNTVYSIGHLFTCLSELDRFPVLFIVPGKDAYETIVEVTQHARNFIPAEQTSVMFRMDNQGEGFEFNQYIKRENINNKLDINTKLVYTIDHTVPKPLLQSNWSPKAVVVSSPGNVPTTKKSLQCFSNVDLIIHYQDEVMPSYKYFYKTDVERIE